MAVGEADAAELLTVVVEAELGIGALLLLLVRLMVTEIDIELVELVVTVAELATEPELLLLTATELVGVGNELELVEDVAEEEVKLLLVERLGLERLELVLDVIALVLVVEIELDDEEVDATLTSFAPQIALFGTAAPSVDFR